jgi:hypothetical protein
MLLEFLRVLLAYTFFFYAGNIFSKLFKLNSEHPFRSVFVKLLIGLFGLVVAFSLCITKGVTINSGLPFLTILILYRVRKGVNFSSAFFFVDREDLVAFGYSLPVLFLFFLYRYITIMTGGSELPIVMNMDGIKHAIRAAFILRTGVESVNVNYLIPPGGVDPYHYFEAWTIGLLGTMLRMNFWVAEQIVAFPIVSTIIVCGFWGILSNWKLAWFYYLLAISVVFFTGFYFYQIENINLLRYTGGFMINAYDEWKGFVVSFAYLIVILSFNLAFSSERVIYSILVLLYLPFLSITLAPSAITISFVLIIIGLLFPKTFRWGLRLNDLMYPVLVAAFIGCFYYFFESKVGYINKPSASIMLKQLTSLSVVKARVIIVAEKAVQALVIYLPYLVIIGYCLVQRNIGKRIAAIDARWHFLLALMITVIAVGAFFWQFFYNMFGANQFLFYTAMPFVNVSLMLLLLLSVSLLKRKMEKGLVITVVAISIVLFVYRSYNIHLRGKAEWFDKYSQEYISNVRREVAKMNVRYGVKIEHKENFVKFNDTHHLLGSFLPGYFNDSYLVSYTLAKMYYNNEAPNEEARMLLPKSPLVGYCMNLKQHNQFSGVDDALLRMIHKYGFSFVFVDKKEQLIAPLLPLVKSEIVDRKSGEKFYVLDGM